MRKRVVSCACARVGGDEKVGGPAGEFLEGGGRWRRVILTGFDVKNSPAHNAATTKSGLFQSTSILESFLDFFKTNNTTTVLSSFLLRNVRLSSGAFPDSVSRATTLLCRRDAFAFEVGRASGARALVLHERVEVRMTAVGEDVRKKHLMMEKRAEGGKPAEENQLETPRTTLTAHRRFIQTKR